MVAGCVVKEDSMNEEVYGVFGEWKYLRLRFAAHLVQKELMILTGARLVGSADVPPTTTFAPLKR